LKITAGKLQSGHTDNQLPPHIRSLFDSDSENDNYFSVEISHT
jgi:hypothetical protein